MAALRAEAVNLEALVSDQDPSSVTIRPGDAKAACAIGEYLITTPNADFIPLPSWTPLHVRLRSNFRYGVDDYTLWPQQYVMKHCHLGAIPRKPSNSADPLAIMWWDPTPEDFVVSPGSHYDAFGTLSPSRYKALRQPCEALTARVHDFLKSSKNKNNSLRTLLKSMEHSYLRLEWCPSSYREMRFAVTELQRYYLEVHAYLDYLTIYKPRMDGTQPTGPVADCIGVFTSTPRIVQDFVEAGLPVFFVRPLVVISTTSCPAIFKVVQPLAANSVVELSDATPPFPVIFRGFTDTPDKHDAMHRYVRTWMVYQSPFADPAAPPASVDLFGAMGLVPNASRVRSMTDLLNDPAPSSASTTTSILPTPATSIDNRQREHVISAQVNAQTLSQASKTNHRNRKADDDKTETKKPRDPFKPFKSIYMPPASPQWFNALEKISRSDKRQSSEAKEHPEFRLYALPDAPLLISSGSEEKRLIYFITWLRIRPALLHLIRRRPHPSQRPQTWRELLELVGRNSGTSSTTLAAGERDNIRRIFSPVLDSIGNVQEVNPNSPPTTNWRYRRISVQEPPSTRVYQEVIWELNEINFRIDLLSLDRRLSQATQSREAKADYVLACFYDGQLLPTHTPRRNQGLVADDWQDRIEYILAFREVLKFWPKAHNSLPSLSKSEREGRFASKQCFVQVESVLLQFYCQMFWNHCGRAPILPYHIQE